MSRSIHITVKNFVGLTKKEQDEQLDDPKSDLRQWSKKSVLKDQVKKERKSTRNETKGFT
jgi:hypothetical protein